MNRLCCCIHDRVTPIVAEPKITHAPKSILSNSKNVVYQYLQCEDRFSDSDSDTERIQRRESIRRKEDLVRKAEDELRKEEDRVRVNENHEYRQYLNNRNGMFPFSTFYELHQDVLERDLLRKVKEDERREQEDERRKIEDTQRLKEDTHRVNVLREKHIRILSVYILILIHLPEMTPLHHATLTQWIHYHHEAIQDQHRRIQLLKDLWKNR